MYKKMMNDHVGPAPQRPYNLVIEQYRNMLGHEKFDSMRFSERSRLCTSAFNALSYDLKIHMSNLYRQKKKEYQDKIDSLGPEYQELIREYHRRWYTNKSDMETVGVALNSDQLADIMRYLEGDHESYEMYEVTPVSDTIDNGLVYLNMYRDGYQDPDISWTLDGSDELTMNHIFGLMEKYGIRIK